MKKNFLLLLFVTIGFSQTNDSLINKIKNKDLKVYFQKYINQKKQSLNFFIESSKPNNKEFIEISNNDNIVFYDKAVTEFELLKKIKNELYKYDNSKYDSDKVFINREFEKTDSLININYSSRVKHIKTKFINLKNPEDISVLPIDECELYALRNESSIPTHDSCKKLGLPIREEANCLKKFFRNQISHRMQKYLEDLDTSVNFSCAVQLIIDTEGKLIFNKFFITSGNLEKDLIVYRGINDFANSIVFFPAKFKDKNINISYNLGLNVVTHE